MVKSEPEDDAPNSVFGGTISKAKHRLVVAIDFGTTFSGIAFTFPNKSPKIHTIQVWPGGIRDPKIATLISYNKNNAEDFIWGSQKHDNIVQGVKLLLDPDQPRPQYLPPSTANSDLKLLGKPAVDAAADFIGALYKHAASEMRSKVQEYYDVCDEEFVLTIPAVWSDKAKNQTLKAAAKAGLGPLTLIKEPEAAALYTVETMKDSKLEVGDAFVICDAGGGTVDLISYEVIRFDPKLEMKELVPGQGSMAGSLGLNMRFEEAVKQVLGDRQYSRIRNEYSFERAMQEFDQRIKRVFKGDPNENYYVEFPDAKLVNDSAKNLEDDFWQMKAYILLPLFLLHQFDIANYSSDIKSIFNPLIDDILGLVQNQVDEVGFKRLAEEKRGTQVKAIFLVGGFGANRYLKNQLELAHPTISIIKPPDAWTAIVKGAVMSQLQHTPSIVSRQATGHYGVKCSQLFNPIRDLGQTTYIDPFSGEKLAPTICWYISRGQDLKTDHAIKIPFHRHLEEGCSDRSLILTSVLIQSPDVLRPKYPSAPDNIKYSMVTDLSTVDRDQF
ncbi:Heat shock 70 kDa protein 12A [Lachnellula suecica]|uniref:Heat shock 70 kDa protein 12A n=1 Tax=Lachnellula suecica TaxID=602035 RepID=A0A8T9CE78_9HELO|nr:Heat shock 70 kDa protein 12A [Lachnellula suecica]